MHQDPHVLNHGKPGKGPRLVPGLCLAIEPMITMGSPRTVELDDGWTVITRDHSMAAHVEHTMALLDDGVWVTTAPDGGRARLGELVTSRQPAIDSVPE
jgi:methionyl aminopeptidase